MFLSVVILGRFTTETHAMALYISTDTPPLFTPRPGTFPSRCHRCDAIGRPARPPGRGCWDSQPLSHPRFFRSSFPSFVQDRISKNECAYAHNAGSRSGSAVILPSPLGEPLTYRVGTVSQPGKGRQLPKSCSDVAFSNQTLHCGLFARPVTDRTSADSFKNRRFKEPQSELSRSRTLHAPHFWGTAGSRDSHLAVRVSPSRCAQWLTRNRPSTYKDTSGQKREC
ncbi:hypothetical protein PICSAR240_03221 [Mycobacterium avium subsp. paratuberculosis]|nr:hypothetical protein PICSAR10_02408 [Mycobacterium avium subsp. paratuberculosis]CAG6907650.1 hypothetical protein PICSAR104_02948 [Mycobacterium avium subsp. paratuberculosis]CAG6908840.1 hypothetical protein PICSAR118_03110 [Mycobacterium avium subsp. paratuberculosis]CAG6911657.1 hypothetical protein PICSAR107_03173 [Mycobacterium avium subsp. paratuberculosis]CAG6916027.1 hypothetical protein PICSAR1_03445 [Mycobacterium avium subsp. paratuberculosis]